MKTKLFPLIILISLIWEGCKVAQHSGETNAEHLSLRPAAVVIYKTKRDYREQVPIMVSEDRQQMISYPHPSDLRFADGSFRFPLSLNKGYLLDRKGIGPRTVFLNIRYEDYITNPPDPSELLRNISDEDPIIEIWHCDFKTSGETLIDSLNYFIDNYQLNKHCKKIK